jgi:ATP-dependent exoDNAse (exonuclease V) alpha subunit
VDINCSVVPNPLACCLQYEVQKFCRDQLLKTSSEAAILEQLLQTHHPLSKVPTMAEPPPSTTTEEDLKDELAAAMEMQPNEEQAAVEATLLQGASGIAVLSGGPGTGKTFLTRRLIHQWRQAGRSVVVAATTGAAASRISKAAQTVHSAFNIPLDGMYLGSMKSYTDLFQRLQKAEIIVIDEMSMLSSSIFNLVLFRLQQCGRFRDIKTMLQNKLIVLVGDHAQVRSLAT